MASGFESRKTSMLVGESPSRGNYNEVMEMSWIEEDRKQVFGVEELDELYLEKIKCIVEERIKELTLEG
jgi:hypothetical protein